MSSDLTALLARVEAAEGPDRGLDADLYWIIEHVRAERLFNAGALGLPKGYPATLPIPAGLGRAGLRGNCPTFTASLDAALALCERVLPGWQFDLSIDRTWTACGVSAKLNTVTFEPDFRARHKTPALALLAAMLKAKLIELTSPEPIP